MDTAEIGHRPSQPSGQDGSPTAPEPATNDAAPPLWAQFAAVLALVLVALGLIAGSALFYARNGGCQDGRGSSLDSGTCVDIGGGL